MINDDKFQIQYICSDKAYHGWNVSVSTSTKHNVAEDFSGTFDII